MALLAEFAAANKLDGFEAQLLDDDTILALVPVDWKAVAGGFGYEPPEPAFDEFGTRFSAGTNCDGFCKAKDWAQVAEKVEFARFRQDGATIESEVALTDPPGRRIVSSQGKRTTVAVARWREGAEKYFYCRAELAGKHRALKDRFTTACTAAALIP